MSASLFGDIAGLAAINTAYNRLGGIGDSAETKSNLIAQDLYSKGQFKPFTVRSRVGVTNVDEQGSMGQYLGGQAGALQTDLFSRAIMNATGPTTGAELGGDLGLNLVERARSEFDQPIAHIN